MKEYEIIEKKVFVKYRIKEDILFFIASALFGVFFFSIIWSIISGKAFTPELGLDSFRLSFIIFFLSIFSLWIYFLHYNEVYKTKYYLKQTKQKQ